MQIEGNHVTNSPFFGILSVTIAAVLWGSTGTVQALISGPPAPEMIGALRLVIGAVTLALIAFATTGALRQFRSLPWRWVMLAGFSVCAYNLLFFRAVSVSGVGIGTAITIGSAPIWASAITTIVTQKLPLRSTLFGQSLAILGVLLLCVSGSNIGSSFGVALALGAGLSYASYSIFTGAIGHSATPPVIASATFGTAALLVLPLLLFSPVTLAPTAPNLSLILFLGVAATGVAYLFYTWGLVRLTATTAVTFALIEPVTAWLLATFLLGEAVTAQNLSGAILVLAGLFVLSFFAAKQRNN